MANVYAVKSGNWSDTTLWNTAALPTTVDDVFAAGSTIFVDQNIQVLSINTRGTTGIGGGGTFRPNNGVVMTTNVFAGSSTCVTFGSASPNAFSLVGNISGGSSTGIFGINGTSTGTINITGNIFGGTGSTAYGIQTINNIINIRGDIYGGTGGSAHGLVFNSSGTIPPSAFIVGNIYNGTGGTSYGVNLGGTLANFVSLSGNILSNPAGGTAASFRTDTTPGSLINITGSVIASGGGVRLEHTSTGTINLVGTVSGSPINLNDHRVISNFGSGTVNITGTVINGRSVNGFCVISGGGGAGTVNIYGDVYGGTVTNAGALYNDGGALMQVFGNIYARDGGGGVQNQANGTFIVYGDVYGSGANVSGIRNNITGTVIVTGSVFGGVGSNGVGAANNGNGLMLIGRNVVAGVGSTAYGANNAATGYMVIGGTVVGNEFGLGSSGIQSVPGVFGSQTGTTIVRSLCCGARGQWPTAGVIRIEPLNSSTVTLFTSALSAGPSTVLFTSLSTNIVPPASSVRQGTVYNLNQSTGTCSIPSISSVLQGVSVDNSIGIAALQPQTIWNYSVLSATDVNSLGGRLANVATVQSIGQQLTALN